MGKDHGDVATPTMERVLKEDEVNKSLNNWQNVIKRGEKRPAKDAAKLKFLNSLYSLPDEFKSIVDRNGRLVKVDDRGNASISEYQYSSDGYFMKMSDRYSGGYGSETSILWNGRSGEKRIGRMKTQFFTGAGWWKRGLNDGQPIVTQFSVK